VSVERIIGIDFGTSTSVVKIKSYKDNVPMESKEMADYVRFDNKDSLPTLIYKTIEENYLVGYEAANAAVKGTLYQSFKLNLVSDDEQLRAQSIELTKIFFKYVYKVYSEQSAYFPICDKETTYISYPAKWPKELINLMIEITKQAGFKNVVGVDEPTAAMYAVMILEIEKLQSSGLVKYGDTANILMIDMGAGTTDLVLCKYKFDNEHKIEILNTWPQAGNNILFGGREIDEILCEYIKKYLIECGLPNTKNFNEKYMDKCKAWKENNLSPLYRSRDGVVKYCGFIDTLLGMLDIDNDFPPLSRGDFETLISNYLMQFPLLISGCFENAKEKFNFNNGDLDFIILTGGHSQWYFTNEIIEGSIKKYGTVNLPKIQKQPERIIKLSRPQETVALGLVYQRLAITVNKPIPKPDPINELGGKRGNTVGNIVNSGYVTQDNDNVYFCYILDNFSLNSNSRKLFKMCHDGSEKKRLCFHECRYINVLDGWVYYRNCSSSVKGENTYGKLFRVRTDGTEDMQLNDDKSAFISVVGSWIYYRNDSDFFKLYKMHLDGSKRTKLCDDKSNNINVVDEWIYYNNGSDQHRIYKIRINGSEKTKLSDDSGFYINVVDGWIYYSNGSDNERIYKIRTDGSEKTRIDDKYFCNSLIVDGGWIYYEYFDNKHLRIYRIKTDGSNKQEFIKTHITNPSYKGYCLLAAAGGWIYYKDFVQVGKSKLGKLLKVSDDRLLRVRTDGTGTQIITD
jgi:hypothetical protein